MISKENLFLFLPLVFMLSSILFPQGKLVLCTLCCLFSMIQICILGTEKSLLAYGGTSLFLILLFGFTATSILYVFLFGGFAFFKYFIEKKTLRLGDELLIKLICFNIFLLFFYKYLNIFFINRNEVAHPIFAIILYNLIFALIDLILTYSLTFIEERLKKNDNILFIEKKSNYR